MQSWTAHELPALPVHEDTLQLFDTATGQLVHPQHPSASASLYVCGITPYDATHLGHANTYVGFDLLVRYWRGAGLTVTYTQNVTDVDDPLLERADATGQDWRELADEQTELFRSDMHALNVLPPDHYLSVSESMDSIERDVAELLDAGLAYPVPTPQAPEGDDLYFDLRAAEQRGGWQLGSIGAHTSAEMAEIFPQRGGDPQRAGKRDPLDPLLWRAHRAGEPRWSSPRLGPGRPGWHIECCSIARDTLPAPFTVQGGGSDLRFPHHEFSAAHAEALTGQPMAHVYVHSGMVAMDGEKMSKSLGNLELVSRLTAAGVDPMTVRTLLTGQHYRSDWDYRPELVEQARTRRERWQSALERETSGDGAAVHAGVVAALSRDLDAPAAQAILDDWAQQALSREATAPTAGPASSESGNRDVTTVRVADVAAGLLGITL
ncbi:MAG: cysteine--1-D-myo-inosityl 2-amino-2-deoxy-alpha-D-glucopyranoside ligase [Micrococcus sp.]|nr:cysteine--1-D-myo-inosityl 2-amino-2-deoxy-alpha-D-glucopyranoside ligase [Micrococcus sp.]